MTPTDNPLRRALDARRYSLSESHPSETYPGGYRIIVAFNTFAEMQAAAEAIANDEALTATHPQGADDWRAVAEWFEKHDAYHKASDVYNARVEFIRQHDLGSYAAAAEYKFLSDAQKATYTANEVLYQAIRNLQPPANGTIRDKERKTGFVLMVFPFEQFNAGDSRCNYISNGADRKDVVILMKEMIARFEGQPEIEGHA